MANPSADTIPGRFEVKATASDHFSWLRTRLSIERTMMAHWSNTDCSSFVNEFANDDDFFGGRQFSMPGTHAPASYFTNIHRIPALSRPRLRPYPVCDKKNALENLPWLIDTPRGRTARGRAPRDGEFFCPSALTALRIL
jgi:hypothetical protein